MEVWLFMFVLIHVIQADDDAIEHGDNCHAR